MDPSNPQKQSTTECLPDDILEEIVTSYLNPRDRQFFSSTNRRHRRLFPTPLRIQIASNAADVAVQQKFYVCPQNQTQKILSSHDDLIFGKDYVFWRYDFAQESKIYLSLGIVASRSADDCRSKISMGLCSDARTILSFRVKGGEAGNRVHYGQDVCLEIGRANHLSCIESGDRLCLSAPSNSSPSTFACCVKMQDCSKDATLQLYRHTEFISTKRSTRIFHHAVPDVVSEPFAVFSPRSLKTGNSARRTADDSINFNVWVKDSYIHVQAFGIRAQLSIAVPILKKDLAFAVQDTVGILQLLKRKKSGRWAALMSYFAAILDEHRGKPLNLEGLLRMLAGYHQDYTPHYDERQNAVSLHVAGLSIDTSFPDEPLDKHQVWELVALRSGSNIRWTAA